MAFRQVVQDPNEDSQIEQAVRAELSMSLDASARRFLGVTVECGVVSLTGFVDSYAHKWTLERAAARVVGVKDVRNYLDVLPPHDPDRADRRIQRAAERALGWDARVPDGVHCDVTDGVLRLRGVVERFPEREAAEEAVRNMAGVRDVVNEIRVAPAASPEQLDTDVEAAIRRRFGNHGCRIGIETADGVVTLSGVVATFAMVEDVERAVRAIPGVTRIDNLLLVA